MKFNLIFYSLLFSINLVYAQNHFPSDCAGYLQDFARNFAISQLGTSCNQWVGDCSDPNNTGMNSYIVPISRSGGVMIGAHSLVDSKLAVSGGIISTSLRVLNGLPWPDYVFDKSYNLMPLKDVKTFINQNGHLPKTPSAAEIEKNGGFEIGSVFINHQEKIEEIFLHLIDLKKSVDVLQKENEVLDIEYVALTMQLTEKTRLIKMLAK